MSRRHPLLGDGMSEEFRRQEEAWHEESIVRALLTRFQLGHYRRDLLQHNQELHGTAQGQLTLHAFYEYFPDFPVYLMTAKRRGLTKHVSVGTLLAHFATRPFIEVYEDLLETVPDDYAAGDVGLIIAWPRVRPGGLILHRQVNDVLDVGTRLVFRQQHTYYFLETFPQFLQQLIWEHGRET